MNRKMLELIGGYEEWISKFLEEGRRVYLVSFQFYHISGSNSHRLEIMKAEIERFYTTLLTRVVRNPQRAVNRDMSKFPVLIASPDRPVGKRNATHRLSAIKPNDGVHFHVVLAIPKESRLKVPFKKHFKEHYELYKGNHRRVSDIHVRRLRDQLHRPADYVLKHVKRGSFTTDDILLLPESL